MVVSHNVPMSLHQKLNYLLYTSSVELFYLCHNDVYKKKVQKILCQPPNLMSNCDMLWLLLFLNYTLNAGTTLCYTAWHGNVAFYGLASHANELPSMNGIQPFVVECETSRIATFNLTVFSCISTDLTCTTSCVTTPIC